MKTAYRLSIATMILTGVLVHSTWANDRNTISSTGSASQMVKPDIAYITLFVKGTGLLMSDAAKKASDNVETVLTAIGEGRTNRLDVTVTTVDVGEVTSHVWSGDQQSAPPRPQVSKKLRIAIQPEPALAYEIIDAAIRAGAILTRDSMTHYSGEVSGTLVYGVQDGNAIEKELRKDAIKDARQRAETTAQMAGMLVGPICSIGCHSTTTWSQGVVFGGEETEYPIKHLSINSEQIEIEASISITFEIHEK